MRAFFDHVNQLTSRGHTVEVWTPHATHRQLLQLPEGIRQHVVPLGQAPQSPSRGFRSTIDGATSTLARMRVMEEHCAQCAAEISAGSFDVLLAHPGMLYHATPIARFTSLPSVLYLQEPYRPLYEAMPTLPWVAPTHDFSPRSLRSWKRFIGDSLRLYGVRVQAREERQWVASFDQVLVNSRFSRESVLRAYHIESRVCYLGVDTVSFVPTREPKERFVVGLGNIYPHKRPTFAVDCIAAIPDAKRPKLVWVGNGGDGEALAQYGSDKGVTVDVRLGISQAELVSVLSRAAALIYPSHLEPFGYAPLEANACGTAVVAIAEGGMRESLEHNVSGALLDNLDPMDFAASLLAYCDDLSYAEEQGRRARERVVSNWSIEAAGLVLERELERCVEGHRG